VSADWYPGAVRIPGVMANYARGRTGMRACVLHYTVGRDSTNIGRDGKFSFLIRRNGEVVQFAPVDALTWHAGEWNTEGPGIEHEFYEPVDGPSPANILTPAQETASGALCRWLRDDWGISGQFYDGPRISKGYRGFITHRSLQQTQRHSDYITAEQWSRMTAGTLAGPPVDWAAIVRLVTLRREEDPTMNAHVMFDGASHYFTRATDGRLAHIWYAAGKWNVEDVNAAAGQPGYRLAEGASIVARTKELHGAENQIEVGWTGMLGEPGHTWFNRPKWGTELLPALV